MTRATYHHGNLKKALIEAGIQVLAEDGIKGFSLRKVARLAGVSHAAPYAHFADKQELIAAISTEGFRQLNEKMIEAVRLFPSDPLRKLVELSWVYVSFATSYPAHFKIIFSGFVEEEWRYPELLGLIQSSLMILQGVVNECQEKKILGEGSTEVTALTVWSLVHGMANLILDRQFPDPLLESFSRKRMVVLFLEHFVKIDIPQEYSADI